MMKHTLRLLMSMAFAVAFTMACAPEEETRLAAVDEHAIVARDGDVLLAAQPSLEDLDAWAEQGVGVVVNFRSRAEVEGLPFDSETEVTSRGMTYVGIPMGGADGVRPEMRTRLTEVLRGADGPVVLHCRSGVRAANAYAAHLVSQGETTLEDLEDFGWPGGLSDEMLASLLDDDEE